MVQAALNALTQVSSPPVNGAVVAGFGYPNPYVITFPAATGPSPAVTVNTSGCGGSYASSPTTPAASYAYDRAGLRRHRPVDPDRRVLVVVRHERGHRALTTLSGSSRA